MVTVQIVGQKHPTVAQVAHCPETRTWVTCLTPSPLFHLVFQALHGAHEGRVLFGEPSG